MAERVTMAKAFFKGDPDWSAKVVKFYAEPTAGGV
jgi:hypothetical protein